MTHAIEPGGRFERARHTAFLASGGAVVLYHDRAGEGAEPARRRKPRARRNTPASHRPAACTKHLARFDRLLAGERFGYVRLGARRIDCRDWAAYLYCISIVTSITASSHRFSTMLL